MARRSSPLIAAAKACKGKPGFKSCVMSKLSGRGGKRRSHRRRSHSRR